MQKGAAQPLLILVSIILLVFGGVYLYRSSKVNNLLQSPKSETAPIEPSYTNESLGFGFQYSTGFSVKVDSEEEFNKRGNGNFRKNFKGYVGYEPGIVIGAVVILDKTSSFETNPLAVWVFDNPNNLTVDSWFAKYWYYPYLWGVFDWASKGHITPDKEATISGQVAKYKIVSYQLGQPKFMYISKDKKMYLFRIINDSVGNGDQILSSFTRILVTIATPRVN